MNAANQNLALNASGDGSIYDSINATNFNYLDKLSSSSADGMKINFDPQLFEVLRNLESKTSNMSLDDGTMCGILPGGDQFNNSVLKNMSPFIFSPLPQREERYSRKVFVGGLPPDIDEGEWGASVVVFGVVGLVRAAGLGTVTFPVRYFPRCVCVCVCVLCHWEFSRQDYIGCVRVCVCVLITER